jgi:hypothetical protein
VTAGLPAASLGRSTETLSPQPRTASGSRRLSARSSRIPSMSASGTASATLTRRPSVGRKRSALDWMVVAVEEHGREIVEVYLQAMRGGDWRAAEALMSRIYGKPTEIVVTHTPVSPEKAVFRSMTLDEKLELLQRLQKGEISARGVPAIVDPG